MADSYGSTYLSPRAGTQGHQQESPVRERIVMPNRFDPQERLEVNTRKVEKKKEVAAQVELIREEIRSRSMPFSTSTPTVIGERENSVRSCRCFRQQKQRLDNLTLTPIRSAETPMPSIEENINRIVMPHRLNPRIKLEMKQEMKKQAHEEMEMQNQLPSTTYPGGYSPQHTYENIRPQHPPLKGSMTMPIDTTPPNYRGSTYTTDDYQRLPTVRRLLSRYAKPDLSRWSYAEEDLQSQKTNQTKPSQAPKKPPRQRRPGQGSAVDSTPPHQALPRDIQAQQNRLSTISLGAGRPSDQKYPSKRFSTATIGGSPLQPESSPADEMPLDRFCVSLRVSALDSNSYRKFLGDKGVALVMFYKPSQSSSIRAKNNFVKAAESTNRENAAFAAVDCSLQEALCFNEGITKLPTFKLYSQGNLVNIVKDSLFFNDRDMKKFVEDAPAMAQEGVITPSCRSGKSLLKKAIQKIRHHK